MTVCGMGKRIVAGLILLAGLLAAAAIYSSAGARLPIPPDRLQETISNSGEVVRSIREGLKAYSSKITVTFTCGEDVLSDLPRLVEAWMDQAMEETGDPAEGDYIRYQTGGYSSSSQYDRAGGLYRYTLEIVPSYYLYYTQEQIASEKAEAVFESFHFSETTPEYEKIRTIYDYLCQHVKYDKVHLKNPHYHMRSTAYAALVQGAATCQGYCVSLYRLLRMAGIDSRIVTGSGRSGEEELHAWNIVELDGRYYVLDATWDAGREEYEWFLRGSGGLEDHTPGELFVRQDFIRRYPLAEADYPGS